MSANANFWKLIQEVDLNSILFWVSIILAIKLISFVSFSGIKSLWLKKLGFSKSENAIIFSNRRNNFSLKEYLSKNSDRNIRLVDGLPRKLVHFFPMLTSLFIAHHFIMNSVLAGISVAICSLLFTFFIVFLYSSNSFLAKIIFGATTRIRDGKEARKNYLIAHSLGSLCAICISGLVLLNAWIFKIIPNETLFIAAYFIFLPASIGDTLGEVIGSLAQQNISVKGIGEINKKSTVGSIAVFLGSLIPLLFVTLLLKLDYHYYGLMLVISIITTITELKVPRSTDSFFIPVVNTLVVSLWYGLFVFST